MMIYLLQYMLTPTARVLPPHTAADMAHSTHSTQPALRPHRTTPRAEDKPPQTRPTTDPTQTVYSMKFEWLGGRGSRVRKICKSA